MQEFSLQTEPLSAVLEQTNPNVLVLSLSTGTAFDEISEITMTFTADSEPAPWFSVRLSTGVEIEDANSIEMLCSYISDSIREEYFLLEDGANMLYEALITELEDSGIYDMLISDSTLGT
jgi:hypothetical protein